ncbi:MAG: helix-turn-helix domain-containing protein [Actinomycetota bacterium]
MGTPTVEQVAQAPHPRIGPFVAEYVGYRLSGFAPGTYVGMPSRFITFVVPFGDPLDVSTGPGDADRERYWGLLAGLHSHPAMIHHQGDQHGVELAVTPLGATALFGLPAAELASSHVHLDQVAPQWADEMIERLTEAESWQARWAVVDHVLTRFVREDARLAPQLEQAWTVLAASHGATRVDQLARDVGWSRRHLNRRFQAEYGLTPKVMGRVFRFEQTQKLLRRPDRPSLSTVAALCGYADQAHLTREWNQFAGIPPSAWITAHKVPNVQDNPDPVLSS